MRLWPLNTSSQPWSHSRLHSCRSVVAEASGSLKGASAGSRASGTSAAAVPAGAS